MFEHRTPAAAVLPVGLGVGAHLLNVASHLPMHHCDLPSTALQRGLAGMTSVAGGGRASGGAEAARTTGAESRTTGAARLLPVLAVALVAVLVAVTVVLVVHLPLPLALPLAAADGLGLGYVLLRERRPDLLPVVRALLPGRRP